VYNYSTDDPTGNIDRLGLLPSSAGSEGTCLLCTVFAEAGSSPPACQRAVASVIVNRLAWNRAFPSAGISSVCGVVSQSTRDGHQQFNGYGDNNYRACEKCSNMSGPGGCLGDLGSGFPITPGGPLFFYSPRFTSPHQQRLFNDRWVPVPVAGCPEGQFQFFTTDPFRPPRPGDF
jgi:hypothetical protein